MKRRGRVLYPVKKDRVVRHNKMRLVRRIVPIVVYAQSSNVEPINNR